MPPFELTSCQWTLNSSGVVWKAEPYVRAACTQNTIFSGEIPTVSSFPVNRCVPVVPPPVDVTGAPGAGAWLPAAGVTEGPATWPGTLTSPPTGAVVPPPTVWGAPGPAGCWPASSTAPGAAPGAAAALSSVRLTSLCRPHAAVTVRQSAATRAADRGRRGGILAPGSSGRRQRQYVPIWVRCEPCASPTPLPEPVSSPTPRCPASPGPAAPPCRPCRLDPAAAPSRPLLPSAACTVRA